MTKFPRKHEVNPPNHGDVYFTPSLEAVARVWLDEDVDYSFLHLHLVFKDAKDAQMYYFYVTHLRHTHH